MLGLKFIYGNKGAPGNLSFDTKVFFKIVSHIPGAILPLPQDQYIILQ